MVTPSSTRPTIARQCADRGIVFTVVPTNSYYLRTLAPDRWALDHPIRRMPGLGLRIHPNTDDPTLHKVTPTGAWWMMLRDFGFGLDDLRGFMLNGLDGAWIDDTTRRALARRAHATVRQPARSSTSRLNSVAQHPATGSGL
jgi:adenosine deaminase